jgi:hypothetical protein
MRALVLLAGILLMNSGCALWPSPAESMARTGSVEVIEAPAEGVWPLLAEVYAALGLDVTTSDAEAHVVASTRAHNVWAPWIGPQEAPYARCTGPRLLRSLAAVASSKPVPVSVPTGYIVVTVESELVPDETRTRLRTRVILSPVSLSGAAGHEEPYCVSTGRLESGIAEALRERLGMEGSAGA